MPSPSSEHGLPVRNHNRENQELPAAFGTFHGIQRSFQRLFDDFLFSTNHRRGLPWSFNPSIEIDESEDKYSIQVDIPGVAKKDVHLEIRDNNLVVFGERKDEHQEKDGDRRHTERSYGSFYRSFPLPPNVNFEQIQANYRNGVLRVTLPKTESIRPKSIPIQETADDHRPQKPERAA